MASSGSYNFSVTAADIVKTALQHISAIGDGDTPSTTQYSEGILLLNMLIKLREKDGMPVWGLKRGYILPFTGTAAINTDSHVVTSYAQTTTSAAAASGASSVTLTSATGISTGDHIGIWQDDSTVLWTTVTMSGTTATLANVTTDTVTSGNYVYAYTATNRIQKPLRITGANMMDLASSTSWEITQDSREDYFRLSNRSQTGVPNQFYYDLAPSDETQVDTNGTIYVYPIFNVQSQLIEFNYVRPFQDIDTQTDTFDFPQPFYLPIMIELASLLGPKNGVDIKERQALKQEAQMYLEEALETVYPEGSLFLQPDYIG